MDIQERSFYLLWCLHSCFNFCLLWFLYFDRDWGRGEGWRSFKVPKDLEGFDCSFDRRSSANENVLYIQRRKDNTEEGSCDLQHPLCQRVRDTDVSLPCDWLERWRSPKRRSLKETEGHLKSRPHRKAAGVGWSSLAVSSPRSASGQWPGDVCDSICVC